MKKLVLSLCLLTIKTAFAADVDSPQMRSNRQATSDYYAQLLSSRSLDLAGLNLFANMMPKGGDLHHHFSGAHYAETYLDWIGQKGFCVYKTTDSSRKIEKFRVVIKPQELSEAKRDHCISAQDVREDNAFYRNLLMAWSSKDYANHYHEETAPDEHFFDTFKYFEGVASQSQMEGLALLKQRAKQENVSYIETLIGTGVAVKKPAFQDIFAQLKDQSTPQEMIEVLTRAYEFLANDADTTSKINELADATDALAAGIDDAEFRMRFMLYASRNSTPDVVFSRLYTSFAAAQRSQKIVGVNIVGPENGYIAMRDYAYHMQMFQLLGKHFPEVKRSLHAGELVLGMVPPEGLRNHIHQAVTIAGAQRIGHGVDIAHETGALKLLDAMARNKVAVEVNLTSNQDILGVSAAMHPMSIYKRFNVPMVIATDDAGVSRNNLSGEYLLYMSRYQPTYDELKETVYNSIKYSFLNDSEKRGEMKGLDARFADFEARIAALPRQKR